MTEQEIDILAVLDTNLADNATRYNVLPEIYRHEFSSWWAPADENKITGSGVGLIMNSKWSPHKWKHTIYSPYFMKVQLACASTHIWVWILYAAPQVNRPFSTLKEAIEQIMREMDTLHQPTLQIFLGDFNVVRDPVLDRLSTSQSLNTNRPTIIFNPLLAQSWKDVYRELHPSNDDSVFTYHQASSNNIPRSEFCIDYIWIGCEETFFILDYNNFPADILTSSDHSIITTVLDISGLFSSHFSHTKLLPKDAPRDQIIVDLDNISPSQWDEWSHTLEQFCSSYFDRDTWLQTMNLLMDDKEAQQDFLDKTWEHLESIIFDATKFYFP